METIRKNVINVQELEPSLRHDTIFEVFEGLSEGESLLIRNDHDPKPVYFQMMEIFGDTFLWEYDKEGPELWEISVTKVDLSKQGIVTSSSGEKIIDVPSISHHALKHQVIFNAFKTLKPGENFIIHNDHDPKAVFHQLQAMHGDTFEWEYIQEGPQWWDVRVTLREENNEETIGEIVAENFHTAEVFKKYGIDFCCQGNRSVRQACEDAGVDVETVEKELQNPHLLNTGSTNNHNFTEWDLGFLADYVTNTHHKYLRKYLPELNMYSDKVSKVHGKSHPELHTVDELLKQVTEEFYSHMKDEETILFPLIKIIEKAKEGEVSYSASENFEAVVDHAEKEHKDVGYALEQIRKLTDDFTPPKDACASYTLLFKMLEEFEGDTFTHIHLENNILFPKAIEMEKTLA
ncbi:MAG TPA: iron-sulfur cluster repair di-iron protein [Brumimicrobium sp.]|nr:iron-sulfur cluster repair di-iron protein [Brumimicrobium sp.]